MPSKSHYDDLPSYQRTRLEELARAVIRSMPRTRRQTELIREAETRRRAVVAEQRQEYQWRRAKAAGTGPDNECRDLPAEPGAVPERRALPRSPHRTYDETTASAEQLREHLRLGQPPGTRPRP